MIEIKTDGEVLDLPPGFSVEIEETNPIYNERGSQSIPATVPMTGKNRKVLGHPHRLDCFTGPNDKVRDA